MQNKVRESGMPEEALWETFFDPCVVLDRLGLRHAATSVVEFGCGYGTFTLPAARRIHGTVYTFDIEPAMIEHVVAKARRENLTNVIAQTRDFVTRGTGLVAGAADYAMLFNILHAEEPAKLLAEAWRVLRTEGLLGVMHWNYNASTPRGPSMDIRPRPEQVRDWGIASGFRCVSDPIDLPPYHYGILFQKPATA